MTGGGCVCVESPIRYRQIWFVLLFANRLRLVPFHKMDHVTAAARSAYENLRPKLSRSCPSIVKKLIQNCWTAQPNERPEFKEVLKFYKHLEGKLFFSSIGGLWVSGNPMDNIHDSGDGLLWIFGRLLTRSKSWSARESDTRDLKKWLVSRSFLSIGGVSKEIDFRSNILFSIKQHFWKSVIL